MAAQSTKTEGILRKTLLTAGLDPPKTASRVEIHHEFMPGRVTGLHVAVAFRERAGKDQ